ncbi:MAG: SAM-dependent methyltransferase [Nocardia sp.]|nr:SAM-dependent methyltransferase [Nocardia sp.]
MPATTSTALWMAAARARESDRPDAIFHDPLAETLAGPDGFALMQTMEEGLPPNPTLSIRTRFFDDQIRNLVTDTGIDQLVILAAGMDTRAYRLNMPPDLLCVEIDHPELVELKTQRLTTTTAEPTCQRVSIAADLTQPWTAELTHTGFDPARPAIFLAEGLLSYLNHSQVTALLRTITDLSTTESHLLVDIAGNPRADNAAIAEWMDRREKAGISQRFGTDEPEQLLAAHQWRAHVIQYGDQQANYGRWPWPPIPRNAPIQHNYLVTAQR